MISLFGPRKGRILHGRFDPSSSDLIVRASPIFNFEKRNKEGFDLFMRYYDCEPQDVVEFESIATGEKSRSPTTTHGRTSPSGIGDETSITSQEPDSEIFARRT